MTIANHLEKVKEGLQQGKFTSEENVKQGIVEPILYELGWLVFDISIVAREFSLEGRRVDYALCHPPHRPSVFIEVKKVGLSGGADRQLFEYVFHEGVPMAILTDGQEWSFYLPAQQGHYDERRVYKLDLLERSIEESMYRLERYLGYKNICSGQALKDAQFDYKNVAKDREIEDNLPKAWSALLKEQDSLLLDLLADKVEDLCGYRPDKDNCTNFLKEQANKYQNLITTQVETTAKKQKPFQEVSQKITEPASIKLTQENYPQTGKRKTGDFSFIFNGSIFSADSGRDVMRKVFQILDKEDAGFLERFSSCKHGRKRRYLARNKYELYPDRPDLAEIESEEILPGWWLMNNTNHKYQQKIINLALEIAGSQLASKFQIDLKS